MARISYKCDECKNYFNVQYLFVKPGKIKCPVCGSDKVKEESVRNNCGCSSTGDRPFRFT